MNERTEHTPGRIRYYENGEANSYALLEVGADDRWLLTLLHNGHDVTQRQIANMRRLVACWNACQDVSTEVLEVTPMSAIVAHMAKKISDETRDELLDALTALVDYLDERTGDTENRPLENARAAIAKATGEEE